MKKKDNNQLDILFVDAVKFLADFFNTPSVRCMSKEWLEDLAFVSYLLYDIENVVIKERCVAPKAGEYIIFDGVCTDSMNHHPVIGKKYRIVTGEEGDRFILSDEFHYLKRRDLERCAYRARDSGYEKAVKGIKEVAKHSGLEKEALQIARGIW